MARGCAPFALLALLLVGCAASEDPESRVLLIGIDGATLRVIDPLMADGRLPNLAAIARAGAYGTLRSEKPMFSPRIWNTIATGKTPDKHGIDDFAHEDEEGSRKLLLSTDRREHALRNIASDAGRRVGVVNWWNTYPLEPIRGVMVADHLMGSEIRGRRAVSKAERAGSQGQLVHPVEWQERVAAVMEDAEPLTEVDNPFDVVGPLPKGPEERRPHLARRYDEDGVVTRIALAVDAEIRPELLMVFLPGIDRISHFLWGTLEPPRLYPEHLRPTRAQRRAGADALQRYYVYTDALIGELARGFGPDDLVMVVSDHGFEAGVGLKALTGVHETDAAIDGVVFARGRGIRHGRVTGMSIRDVTPTILAWMGLAVADDMDGHPAGFLDARPPERIATYETSPVERVTHAPSGSEEEILERLRALGYFERE